MEAIALDCSFGGNGFFVREGQGAAEFGVFAGPGFGGFAGRLEVVEFFRLCGRYCVRYGFRSSAIGAGYA